MNILALETIGVSASAALLEDESVIRTFSLDVSKRSTQALVPAVQAMLATAGRKPQDIDFVAVISGPGSFTGLRVGITFAKIFAYSVDAKLLAIPTLEVIAAGTPSQYAPLSVAIDAQRGEVMAQDFAFQSNEWMPQGERRLERVETWWKKATAESFFLGGPVLARLAERLPATCRTVPAEFYAPNPVVLGRLAWHRFQAGEQSDLWNTLPIYSRLSAAEERRNAKNLDSAADKSVADT